MTIQRSPLYLAQCSTHITAIHADWTTTQLFDVPSMELHADRAVIKVYLLSAGDLGDRFRDLTQLRFSICEGNAPGDAVIDDVLTIAYDYPVLSDEQPIANFIGGAALLARTYTFRAKQRMVRHPRPASLFDLLAYFPNEEPTRS